MPPCSARLGEHECVLVGDHAVHSDALGNEWTYEKDVAPERPPPRSPRRRRRVREGLGLVLLFLFALATFGFVAYVWQSADEPAPYTPHYPTTTAPPSVP